MTEVPGFRFTEPQAKELVARLQRASDLLVESVQYAEANCEPSAVMPYKKWIGEILADLGWAVLEQGFYKKYGHLRPEGSELRLKS